MKYGYELSEKTILITGATGFIGSLIVKRLNNLNKYNKCNIRILAFVRNKEKARKMLGDDVELLIGDIRDDIKMPKNLDKIDYIIHCASITKSKTMIDEPEETLNVAVEGTRNILEIAEKFEAESMVYISSMEVYGRTAEKDNPITEEKLGILSIEDPRSSYPLSKRKCEKLCREFNINKGTHVKIARLAQITGPGIPLTDTRIAMQFARAVIEGKDIILHTKGNSISNYCYTEDALNGIFTILFKGVDGEAYNVCNDSESRSIYNIAELVATKVAKNEIKVKCEIPKSNIYGYAPDSLMRLNSDKLRELGWNANIGIEEAYINLVEYLRKY